MKKTAVVVGALGVIGRAIVEHLSARADWRVIGLSRRAPDFISRAEFISVDLLDRPDAERKLAGLTDVTHIFYCAFQPRPTWAEHSAPNLALLVNAVEPIAAASPALEHVTLIEGNKIYGSHLGPFKTPARETDPPHMPPNFYYDQETWLRRFQSQKPWHWTVLRPHTVCGFAIGSPMNLMSVLAVYAAISKELGLPLRFPGPETAYRIVYQLTDGNLLAKSMHWAATSPAARNEVFNVTNGDFYRWCNVWPRIAEAFEMDWAPPQAIKLADFMPDKAGLWDEMVARHGLTPHAYTDVANWAFADYIFHTTYDVMSSTTKIRLAGFLEFDDTEDMMIRHLADLRARRIVP
ncbi:MAG: SDR family oxidoreductase [Hyphomicrobiaceae bacterium]